MSAIAFKILTGKDASYKPECEFVQIVIRRQDNLLDSASYFFREIAPEELNEQSFIAGEFHFNNAEYHINVLFYDYQMKCVAKRIIRMTLRRDITLTIDYKSIEIPKIPQATIIRGQADLGLSTSRRKQYTVRFPANTFASDNVKVIATPFDNTTSGLAFTATIKQTNRTSFKIDIYRINGSDNEREGWSHLKLNWMAWIEAGERNLPAPSRPTSPIPRPRVGRS